MEMFGNSKTKPKRRRSECLKISTEESMSKKSKTDLNGSNRGSMNIENTKTATTIRCSDSEDLDNPSRETSVLLRKVDTVFVSNDDENSAVAVDESLKHIGEKAGKDSVDGMKHNPEESDHFEGEAAKELSLNTTASVKCKTSLGSLRDRPAWRSPNVYGKSRDLPQRLTSIKSIHSLDRLKSVERKKRPLLVGAEVEHSPTKMRKSNSENKRPLGHQSSSDMVKRFKGVKNGPILTEIVENSKRPVLNFQVEKTTVPIGTSKIKEVHPNDDQRGENKTTKDMTINSSLSALPSNFVAVKRSLVGSSYKEENSSLLLKDSKISQTLVKFYLLGRIFLPLRELSPDTSKKATIVVLTSMYMSPFTSCLVVADKTDCVRLNITGQAAKFWHDKLKIGQVLLLTKLGVIMEGGKVRLVQVASKDGVKVLGEAVKQELRTGPEINVRMRERFCHGQFGTKSEYDDDDANLVEDEDDCESGCNEVNLNLTSKRIVEEKVKSTVDVDSKRNDEQASANLAAKKEVLADSDDDDDNIETNIHTMKIDCTDADRNESDKAPSFLNIAAKRAVLATSEDESEDDGNDSRNVDKKVNDEMKTLIWTQSEDDFELRHHDRLNETNMNSAVKDRTSGIDIGGKINEVQSFAVVASNKEILKDSNGLGICNENNCRPATQMQMKLCKNKEAKRTIKRIDDGKQDEEPQSIANVSTKNKMEDELDDEDGVESELNLSSEDEGMKSGLEDDEYLETCKDKSNTSEMKSKNPQSSNRNIVKLFLETIEIRNICTDIIEDMVDDLIKNLSSTVVKCNKGSMSERKGNKEVDRLCNLGNLVRKQHVLGAEVHKAVKEADVHKAVPGAKVHKDAKSGKERKQEASTASEAETNSDGSSVDETETEMAKWILHKRNSRNVVLSSNDESDCDKSDIDSSEASEVNDLNKSDTNNAGEIEENGQVVKSRAKIAASDSSTTSDSSSIKRKKKTKRAPHLLTFDLSESDEEEELMATKRPSSKPRSKLKKKKQFNVSKQCLSSCSDTDSSEEDFSKSRASKVELGNRERKIKGEAKPGKQDSKREKENKIKKSSNSEDFFTAESSDTDSDEGGNIQESPKSAQLDTYLAHVDVSFDELDSISQSDSDQDQPSPSHPVEKQEANTAQMALLKTEMLSKTPEVSSMTPEVSSRTKEVSSRTPEASSRSKEVSSRTAEVPLLQNPRADKEMQKTEIDVQQQTASTSTTSISLLQQEPWSETQQKTTALTTITQTGMTAMTTLRQSGISVMSAVGTLLQLKPNAENQQVEKAALTPLTQKPQNMKRPSKAALDELWFVRNQAVTAKKKSPLKVEDGQKEAEASGSATADGEQMEEDIGDDEEEHGVKETYTEYSPAYLDYGLSHPDIVVESSSLASVLPPAITRPLHLPREVIDQGKLSKVQLESVTYASQMHEVIMPNNDRAGYLIGDGAGVGKGRTIAGIILENWECGRKRSVWISASQDLMQDAIGDLNDIGASNIPVKCLTSFGYDKQIEGDGVVFSTFSGLVGTTSAQSKRFNTRLDQLQEWLGEDKQFEGPIVFDECHKAKNLVPPKGGKSTKTGLTVLGLQNTNPLARVVYASATGASEPKNMAYMVRLGMWGQGINFRDFKEFSYALEKRGTGGLEQVALDLKLRGSYIARQLSFKGVDFGIEEVPLSQEFIGVYDHSVEVWRKLQTLVYDQCEKYPTEARGDPRKRNFWGFMQKFFKYLAISSKISHVVGLAKKELSNGNCVVIGLQSTGEAATEAEMANKAKENQKADEMMDALDDDDDSEEGPVAEKTNQFSSASSKMIKSVVTRLMPCRHKEVGVFCDPAKCDEKQEVWKDVVAVASRLPTSSLDQLIEELGGPKEVAELTGRKKRLEKGDDGIYSYVNRVAKSGSNKDVNIHEKKLFMTGKKKVAIISEAGSTGISLQADKRVKNQRRRVHFTIELPWSADSAIQQFGRTHRSNQSSAPKYVFVISALHGEKRFASIVAKRLESLGALTHGDRRSTRTSDLSTFNFHTDHATSALKNMVLAISGVDSIPMPRQPPQWRNKLEFYNWLGDRMEESGIYTRENVRDNEQYPTMTRFMNRLLCVKVNDQNVIFSYFTAILDRVIAQAKKEGRYDSGIMDVVGQEKASKVEQHSFEVKYATGLTTTKVTKFNVTRGMSFEEAVERSKELQHKTEGFWLSARQGKKLAVLVVAVPDAGPYRYWKYLIYRPNTGKGFATMPYENLRKRYQKVKPEVARKAWNKQYDLSLNLCYHAFKSKNHTCKIIREGGECEEGRRKRNYHVISGSLLSVWPQIEEALGSCTVRKERKIKMVRINNEEERIIGINIPNEVAGNLIDSLKVLDLTGQNADMGDTQKEDQPEK